MKKILAFSTATIDLIEHTPESFLEEIKNVIDFKSCLTKVTLTEWQAWVGPFTDQESSYVKLILNLSSEGYKTHLLYKEDDPRINLMHFPYELKLVECTGNDIDSTSKPLVLSTFDMHRAHAEIAWFQKGDLIPGKILMSFMNSFLDSIGVQNTYLQDDAHIDLSNKKKVNFFLMKLLLGQHPYYESLGYNFISVSGATYFNQSNGRETPLLVDQDAETYENVKRNLSQMSIGDLKGVLKLSSSRTVKRSLLQSLRHFEKEPLLDVMQSLYQTNKKLFFNTVCSIETTLKGINRETCPSDRRELSTILTGSFFFCRNAQLTLGVSNSLYESVTSDSKRRRLSPDGVDGILGLSIDDTLNSDVQKLGSTRPVS